MPADPVGELEHQGQAQQPHRVLREHEVQHRIVLQLQCVLHDEDDEGVEDAPAQPDQQHADQQTGQQLVLAKSAQGLQQRLLAGIHELALRRVAQSQEGGDGKQHRHRDDEHERDLTQAGIGLACDQNQHHQGQQRGQNRTQHASAFAHAVDSGSLLIVARQLCTPGEVGDLHQGQADVKRHGGHQQVGRAHATGRRTQHPGHHDQQRNARGHPRFAPTPTGAGAVGHVANPDVDKCIHTAGEEKDAAHRGHADARLDCVQRRDIDDDLHDQHRQRHHGCGVGQQCSSPWFGGNRFGHDAPRVVLVAAHARNPSWVTDVARQEYEVLCRPSIAARRSTYARVPATSGQELSVLRCCQRRLDAPPWEEFQNAA